MGPIIANPKIGTSKMAHYCLLPLVRTGKRERLYVSTALKRGKKKIKISLGRSHPILLNQREKSGLAVDNEDIDRLKFVKYVAT